jgi:hypothetical protein
LKEAGDQAEEALAMGVHIRALCGCRVVLAGLFILGMMLATVGCGTSLMEKYRASLKDTGRPQYNWYNGKIEHDLFNGRYQKLEKEDWEDD